jgi:hypothetical protein
MRVVKENGQPAAFGTMLLREWIGKTRVRWVERGVNEPVTAVGVALSGCTA